jgi:penicillin-binding protein-related factor A (putative recombinase)
MINEKNKILCQDCNCVIQKKCGVQKVCLSCRLKRDKKRCMDAYYEKKAKRDKIAS